MLNVLCVAGCPLWRAELLGTSSTYVFLSTGERHKELGVTHKSKEI